MGVTAHATSGMQPTLLRATLTSGVVEPLLRLIG